MPLDRVFSVTGQERAMLSLLLTGICFVFCWTHLIVLPSCYEECNIKVAGHLAVTTFICYNILANVYFTMKIDASGRRSLLPSILKPGWRYCSFCQVNSPPRSYHCHHCDECILKREHHCKFIGCCIGYHNHRYFIVSLFYLCFGAFYVLWFQWNYVLEAVGLKGYFLPVVLVAPHLTWIVGATTAWGMLAAALHAIIMAVSVVTFWLLVLHGTAVASGQTRYERKHMIDSYDLGIKSNVQQVLGVRWIFVWLSPQVPSALLGDGMFAFAVPSDNPKDA